MKATEEQTKEAEILIDSGAGFHISNDQYVLVANHQKEKVLGTGTINFTVQDNEKNNWRLQLSTQRFHRECEHEIRLKNRRITFNDIDGLDTGQ